MGPDALLRHALHRRLDRELKKLRAKGVEVVRHELSSLLARAMGLDLLAGDARLITTLTSFSTAADVTLAELALEAFLPADEPNAEVLRRRWA